MIGHLETVVKGWLKLSRVSRPAAMLDEVTAPSSLQVPDWDRQWVAVAKENTPWRNQGRQWVWYERMHFGSGDLSFNFGA